MTGRQTRRGGPEWKPDKYELKIDQLLDPIRLGITCDTWPTEQDFRDVWDILTTEDKRLVDAVMRFKCETVKDLHNKTLERSFDAVIKLDNVYNEHVLRAICFARLMKLPSDAARKYYFETLMDLRRGPQEAYDHIPLAVKTDKEHLKEMAAKINISGDGKRELFQQLIAYGMQVKEMTPAVIKNGIVVQPAIYDLADPSTAYRALQELAKIDGSYADPGKQEVESIESQASKVKRLRLEVNNMATEQAEQYGGTARQITDEELMSGEG